MRIIIKYANGTDQYPKTITEAYNLSITYQESITQPIRTTKQQVAPGIIPTQSSKPKNDQESVPDTQLEDLKFV